MLALLAVVVASLTEELGVLVVVFALLMVVFS